MIRLALALLVLLPSAAASRPLTADDRTRGAEAIRSLKYPCSKITSYHLEGEGTYRVKCGRHVYRVTVTPEGVPVSLKPWKG